MRVLVVTSQFIKEERGLFFCIENLYDILKRFSNLGSLSICARKYFGKSSNTIDRSLSDLIPAKDIHYIPGSHLRSPREAKQTIETCIKDVDLVIGYVPCVNAYTACKLAKKFNKKFLSYVVGCPWDAYWNHGVLGMLIAPYAYFSLKKCLKMSDFALYVTERFLQKRYPCLGPTCGCSDVRIPNIDEEVLYKHLNRLSCLTEDDPLKITTIANYSVKYKGQHYVIKALARLKKLGVTKFHYYLIGGGSRNRLEQLAKKLGVSDLVHFEGIVPHNHIFEKLDEMHVYIQPSLQEGLPRSVVEAMSRGLLCVCANTAAMPEMVEPEYIVERRSVDDIVNVMMHLSVDKLKKQAKRNFEESKKYEEVHLDEKRNTFFKKIMI